MPKICLNNRIVTVQLDKDELDCNLRSKMDMSLRITSLKCHLTEYNLVWSWSTNFFVSGGVCNLDTQLSTRR